MLGTEPASTVPERRVREQLDQLAAIATTVDPHMTATYLVNVVRHAVEAQDHFHRAVALEIRAGDEIMGRDRSIAAHTLGAAEELRRAAANALLAAARLDAIAADHTARAARS